MQALCDLVPKTTVETVLGRSDFDVSGAIHAAPQPNPDGTTLAGATCDVSIPNGGQTPAVMIEVEPFTASTGAGILRTAGLPKDYIYPADVGIGFASRETYEDAAGTTHDSCVSGLVRGDWVVTVSVQIPAEDRDPLVDTVALAREVVDRLQLPLHPTTPYPDPS